MVVFTCHHCNSSLKRNGIEKHYTYQCKKPPALCCIDCLKDFFGNEYIEHDTCVSEAERYGGSNFVAKQVAVKQNKWVEACLSVRNNANLTGKQLSLVQNVLEYQNIPRSKKKFHNFVSNASRQHYKDTILVDSVFDIFQKAFLDSQSKEDEGQDPVEESEGNGPPGEEMKSDEIFNGIKKKKKKHGEQLVSENGGEKSEGIHVQNEEVSEFDSKLKKKKKEKKRKGDKAESENVEEIGGSTEEGGKDGVERDHEGESRNSLSDSNPQGNKRRKKQKLKQCLAEVERSITNNTLAEDFEGDQNGVGPEKIVPGEVINIDTDVIHEKLSKKERKRKIKELKYQAELKSIESFKAQEEINDEEGASKTKIRKKKRNNSVSDMKVDVEIEHTNTQNVLEQEKELEENGKTGKFNWGEIIIEVLKSKEGHEMSLKRLGKKVIAEYQCRKGNYEKYEKVLGKFNKKVRKTIGVRVLKDCAKLVSNETDS